MPADRRPAIVAVNGHSSSGKTTLAGRLAAALPAAAVLHTDDLAWHQGVFAWDELLLDDVLPVVRAGEPLDYRPPAWEARSRPGSITLPGGLAFLIVEGVGASQASVRAAYDVVIWVETDEPTRLARDRSGSPPVRCRCRTITAGWPRRTPTSPASAPGNRPTCSSTAATPPRPRQNRTLRSILALHSGCFRSAARKCGVQSEKVIHNLRS